MITWYDRDGQPIEGTEAPADSVEFSVAMQTVEKLLGDRDYKIVKQDVLKSGRVVSTVWLALDHQFGSGPPLIFETMVFESDKDYTDLDSARYTTEEEAIAGHENMVKTWENEGPLEVDE